MYTVTVLRRASLEHVRERDVAAVVSAVGQDDERLAAELVRVSPRARQLAQRDVERLVHRRSSRTETPPGSRASTLARSPVSGWVTRTTWS